MRDYASLCSKRLLLALALFLALTTSARADTLYLPIVWKPPPSGRIEGIARYYRDGEFYAPAAFVKLYLAELSSFYPPYARANLSSPNVRTGQYGTFKLLVSPGWYAWAMWTPLGLMPIVDAVEGTCLAFEVIEGETAYSEVRIGGAAYLWAADPVEMEFPVEMGVVRVGVHLWGE